MTTSLMLALFAVFSAALIGVFWNALRAGWTHAVPRLIAFEAIIGLVVMHAPGWFTDPGSLRQLVSWAALGASILLALHGFALLRTRGAPSAGIETTTVIVRKGAYRWIRHPLYLSLMLFALGAFLKGPGVVAAVLLLLAVASLAVTAGVEEKENVARLGDAYRTYMRKSKRFIPYVY